MIVPLAGGTLIGVIVLGAALGGSDRLVLWVVRVLLGLTAVLATTRAFIRVRFGGRGAAAPALQALGVFVVLLLDFSTVGVLLGLGVMLFAVVVDRRAKRA